MYFLDSTHVIFLSIFFGTIAGLVIKYFLDKRYVFGFKAENGLHDGKIFLLYSLMGLITTALFWGVEFGFHYWFDTRLMRYTGAVIGLAAGYVMKYQLDKHFVFKKAALC